MKFNGEYLGTPSGILKLFEIMFVVIAFGIFRGKPVNFGEENANYFGCGVLVACLIITPLLLVCYLMGRTEIQETILELALNLLFFVFLFSVSLTSILYWRDVIIPPNLKDLKTSGMTLASFTLLASVAYMVDIFFAAKNLKDAFYGN